jgi:CRISPR/Cas system CSM-associated protein Csm3 (group 7 of RAMP superfamily)
VEMAPLPCENQQCAVCWTCRVFGHGGGQDEDTTTVGARSLVRLADTVIVDPVEVCRTHIAIDRFTGGVLDGALYQAESLESGSFHLRVDHFPDNLPESQREEIRAVLRLVLEDLDDGLIGMGGGTARGYGSVRVDLATAEAAGDLPSAAQARQVLAQMVRQS